MNELRSTSLIRRRIPASSWGRLMLAPLGVGLLMSGLLTATSTAAFGASSRVTASEIKQAQSLLAKVAGRPTSIGVTAPVGKPIPTNKTIDLLDCSEPGCSAFIAPTEAAAAVLGWHVTVTNIGNPQSAAATADLTQAITKKPDAIFTLGIPASGISPAAAAAAKAAHIPIISGDIADPAGGALTAVVNGATTASAESRLIADWDVAKLHGKGATMVVTSPAISRFTEVYNAFKSEYSKLCSGCQLDTLNISGTDIGTPAMTTAEVGYVRAHPNISSIFLAYGGLDAGLRTGLQQAGVSTASSIPIEGVEASPTNLSNLKSSGAGAWVIAASVEVPWRAVDAFARYFVGKKPSVDDSAMALWMVTPQTVNALPAAALTGSVPAVANYQSQYKKLWGK